MAAGVVAVAAGAGLLLPRAVLAAWPKEAFKATTVDDALAAAFGGTEHEETDKITVTAPDIAENGAVVPVKVDAELSDVESIAIFAAGNNSPMTAQFVPGESALPYVSTRIKMGKTSDVIAVVEAEGKLYSAKKEVKVTIGGCGG
jgi:sulfur-oxidizing protein SoxY